MPENQNQTLPEQIALPPAVAPVSGNTVLGVEAVDRDRRLLKTQFEIDNLQTDLQTAQSLEAKRRPENGFVAYQLGKLTGKSLTSKQAVWLERNQPSDLEGLIERRQVREGEREASKKESLLEVRERLLNLNDSERSLLNGYLRETASPFLRQLYSIQAAEQYKASVSSGEDIWKRNVSWAYLLGHEATDEQLTNFLQWHFSTLAEQSQSPELAVAIEKERAAYKRAVQKGIDEGWISPDAQEAIDKVDDVKVYIGDIFDTLIAGFGGYHRSGSDYVVIAQGTGRGEEQKATLLGNLRHVLMHEWNHAVLGSFGTTFGAKWINEALTEHIARSFKYGDHELVSPGERKKDSDLGAYVERRELLKALLSEGADIVGVYEATKLYSVRKRNKDWEPNVLQDKLNKSWGVVAAIQDVSHHVSLLEEKYVNDGMSYMEAQAAAAHEALSDLLQQPEVIFGKGYVRPDKRELASV